MEEQNTQQPLNSSQGLGPAAGQSIERGNTEGGKGPLIGTIIIVILLIVGGAYFLTNRIEENRRAGEMASSTLEAGVPDPETTALKIQGTSTDLADIENDALNSDISNLDKELDSIESEISY
jgi:hypothetical protein